MCATALRVVQTRRQLYHNTSSKRGRRHSTHIDTPQTTVRIRWRKSNSNVQSCSILAMSRAQTGLPDHRNQRNSRSPIVLTLHVALPRVRCIPDKAGTAFDGVIEGLVALTSAFLLLYQWMPTLCYAGRPDNRPRISRSNTQQGQWLITQRQS